jgi:CBS domain containing-hemolysin-like protein
MLDSLLIHLLKLVGVAALIAANGFFVAVEFSLVSARRTRIEQLAAQDNSMALLARSLLDNPDRFIAAAQLGITMASLALGWIGEETIAELVQPPLQQLIGPWSNAVAHTVGTVLAFGLITFLHIVLGEQVPKTAAIRYGERALLLSARPMDAFFRLFRLFIWVLDVSTMAVVRLLGLQPIAGHHTVYSVDELKLLLKESQEGGVLEADQEEMARKVFDFGGLRVNEVMIPRPEIVGVEENETVEDLLQAFSQASHACFPVYKDDLDNITGTVAIKEVLRALAANPHEALQMKVKELALPAFAVPETRAVADLFADMQAHNIQMAVVIDEYGGTAGIVTLEELVEEIVGTLSDELVAQEPRVEQLDELTIRIDAQLRVDEVNEDLGLSLPESDYYETVAGFILYKLGRVPKEGDKLRYKGWCITVSRMKGPKIEAVLISRERGKT